MKTQNDQTSMPSGIEVDHPGTESGEDQVKTGAENSTNNPYLLGVGNRSNIGEMIKRWESSRFMI